MASKPQAAAHSSSSKNSLYMWWARAGSNSEEWMSTQTEGCFSLKSSGSSLYGIRWNHKNFMGPSPIRAPTHTTAAAGPPRERAPERGGKGRAGGARAMGESFARSTVAGQEWARRDHAWPARG